VDKDVGKRRTIKARVREPASGSQAMSFESVEKSLGFT
jgi:hypothetical protein